MDRDFLDTVTAAQSGDEVAFSSLFDRNLPRLIGFIRMKAGDALLEQESVADIAQSVCREVLVDMEGFEYRGEEQFRNWLFLQARRKLVSRHRYYRAARRDVRRESKKRRAAADNEADDLLQSYATFCTPSGQLSAREEVERLEQAISQLPENQREAISLSRVAELPYPAVAEIMGCSESAVRGLVARGLARLASTLSQDHGGEGGKSS